MTRLWPNVTNQNAIVLLNSFYHLYSNQSSGIHFLKPLRHDTRLIHEPEKLNCNYLHKLVEVFVHSGELHIRIECRSLHSKGWLDLEPGLVSLHIHGMSNWQDNIQWNWRLCSKNPKSNKTLLVMRNTYLSA